MVAAVRADYLGRLIAYPPLQAALDAGLFTVGPMSEAEVRLAVTGPAAEAGLAVEPAVVEAVIAELRGEGWRAGRRGAAADVAGDGRDLGTPRGHGADAARLPARGRGRRRGQPRRPGRLRHPDRVAKGRGPAGVSQLTIITADGQFARRRCRRADLSSGGTPMAADINAVIGVFSARRLLVLGQDGVEIAHDALLQAWKQLRDWLGDDQLGRALYSQVVTDAAAWDSNGRDSAYLYRPGRLATVDAAAARWRARRPATPAACHQRSVPRHRASRRAPRRPSAARVIAGLLALTVIAVSAAGIAVRAAASASRQAASASRQHAIALSRQLAAESLAADPASPFTARRLAVAAWRVFPTDQAGSVLASLLMEQQQEGILPGDPANLGVNAVAFSPDGKLLATAQATAMCGCGIRPPGSPWALPSSPAPARSHTWPGWRSVRTASCWPPPATTGPCGCGIRSPGSPWALPL